MRQHNHLGAGQGQGPRVWAKTATWKLEHWLGCRPVRQILYGPITIVERSTHAKLDLSAICTDRTPSRKIWSICSCTKPDAASLVLWLGILEPPQLFVGVVSCLPCNFLPQGPATNKSWRVGSLRALDSTKTDACPLGAHLFGPRFMWWRAPGRCFSTRQQPRQAPCVPMASGS